MGKIKTALAIVAASYLAAYTGLASYANLDYRINKEKIVKNAQNHLIVKDYNLKINGLDKKLALIGENHNYTEKETDFALKLLKDYSNVAFEGSSKPLENKVFYNILSAITSRTGRYANEGNGRNSPDSGFISTAYGKNIFSLENQNPYDTLSKTQKISLIASAVKDRLTAPLKYFKGKAENKLSIEDYEKSLKAKKIWASREVEMSKNIEAIIKRKDVKNLAVFVGAKHLKNIDSNLNKKFKKAN